MAEKQIFEVLLEKHENIEATGITIPFDVEKVFGAKRVPVKVWINGAGHRSTIIRMGGKYVIAVPKDFADALKKVNLQDVFSKMSFTHQKEYVRAIVEARKEETRIRRIEKTIEQLISKRK